MFTIEDNIKFCFVQSIDLFVQENPRGYSYFIGKLGIFWLVLSLFWPQIIIVLFYCVLMLFIPNIQFRIFFFYYDFIYIIYLFVVIHVQLFFYFFFFLFTLSLFDNYSDSKMYRPDAVGHISSSTCSLETQHFPRYMRCSKKHCQLYEFPVRLGIPKMYS